MSTPQAPFVVEFAVASKASGAAQAGRSEVVLSQAQLTQVQIAINTLVAGFQPPPPKEDERLGLDAVEVELGFVLKAGTGSFLRLVLADVTGEASIKAKATWKRRT